MTIAWTDRGVIRTHSNDVVAFKQRRAHLLLLKDAVTRMTALDDTAIVTDIAYIRELLTALEYIVSKGDAT